jgi:hypothetical protein
LPSLKNVFIQDPDVSKYGMVSTNKNFNMLSST